MKKERAGPMQLQGEVMELAIEDWLKSEFPFDKIDEIKKSSKKLIVYRQLIKIIPKLWKDL